MLALHGKLCPFLLFFNININSVWRFWVVGFSRHYETTVLQSNKYVHVRRLRHAVGELRAPPLETRMRTPRVDELSERARRIRCRLRLLRGLNFPDPDFFYAPTGIHHVTARCQA